MVTDQDRRRLIREWNREIEDETWRLNAGRDSGKWRFVAWGAVWLVWLGVLVGLVAGVRALHW